MADFGPDNIRILVVEDHVQWRRSLKKMYCRMLRQREGMPSGEGEHCVNCLYRNDCFGLQPSNTAIVNLHPNIDEASTAEEAQAKLEKEPHSFQLISLDINLGTQQDLGLGDSNVRIGSSGLDVFDLALVKQRGAAIVVITGANHDAMLPDAIPDKAGLARARATLASELNDKLPGSSDYLQKTADGSIEEQVRGTEGVPGFESRLPRQKIIRMLETREKANVPPSVPVLCLMLCLEDSHFDGAGRRGADFHNAERQCVPFDPRALHYLKQIDIWPDGRPEDIADYYEHAKAAFEQARGVSKAILKKHGMVLRSKPAGSKALLRPNERHTITVQGEMKARHFNWLCEAAVCKVMREDYGPTASGSSKSYASQVRTFLRKQFELREDDIDPVKAEDGYYKISLEVFLCSRSYLNV